MADKQGGETAKAEASSESALLREEIVSLISSRLETIGINPPRQEISKVLNKRKKKWRKRHGSEPHRPAYQPLDPSLREEKETISFTLDELRGKLVQRRREGFSTARQQQRQKGEYCLEAFSHWLQNTQDFLQSYQTGHTVSQPENTTSEHNFKQHEQLIQDLQSAISQAGTLSEIQAMKHDMTPRLPPIQDRTLSGNILDASLGVFHLREQPVVVDKEQEVVEVNGVSNGDEEVVTEYLDAQLTIGKVVSVGQDSCYKSDIEDDLSIDRSMCTESDDKNETAVLRVDNESSDDTPGVGMEIICGATSDLETSPFVVSQSHGSNNNSRVGGCEEIDSDLILHELDTTYSKESKLPKKRKTRNKGIDIIENSTDTDSDSQFGKILQIIERAPYELRIPPKNKNYSTGIRRRRRRTTPRSRGTTPKTRGKK